MSSNYRWYDQPPGVAESVAESVAEGVTEAVAESAAENSAAELAALLPPTGTVVYDSDGRVATDVHGLHYTYNPDGTLHTVSDGTTTRTYAYNNGKITGVS